MSVQNDHQVSHSQAENAWTDNGSDFVLIAEGKPPPRIELAKERMLICRSSFAVTESLCANPLARSSWLMIGNSALSVCCGEQK